VKREVDETQVQHKEGQALAGLDEPATVPTAPGAGGLGKEVRKSGTIPRPSAAPPALGPSIKGHLRMGMANYQYVCERCAYIAHPR
jgi:hypothetical protein